MDRNDIRKEKCMCKKGLFVVLAMLVLVGCATPVVETPKPVVIQVPDLFKDKVIELLDEGALLNALTSQGVNYSDFCAKTAEVAGAYNMAQALWPEGFASGGKEEIAAAIEGWLLVTDVWALGLDDLPLFDEYDVYNAARLYLGLDNTMETKAALTTDNAIGYLMSEASDHFTRGTSVVLGAIAYDEGQDT